MRLPRCLTKAGIAYHILGHVSSERKVTVHHNSELVKFKIDELRDLWFKTSYLLDSKQRSGRSMRRSVIKTIKIRFLNIHFRQPLMVNLKRMELIQRAEHHPG